jgi:acetyl esterase/lipase
MDGAPSSAGGAAPGEIRLGPQAIPEPSAVSEQARVYLRTPFWAGDRERLDPDDIEGWKAAIEQTNAMFAPLAQAMREQADVDVEQARIGGVTVYVATPRRLAPESQGRGHVYIHGGGWAFMGGEVVAGQTALQAHRLGLKTYGVDYRVPPEHRYPAALDDCVAVYRELLKDYAGGDIVISGGSAGGNLTAATALMARDLGLEPPAAIALLTPATDGSLQSDSMATNDQLCILKNAVMSEFWAVYAGGRDRTDPYLSPVFGDFSRGYPPTLLQTGTRDLLLSDTVRMHRALRAAGITAELHVWEAMPHGGFGGSAPEDAEIVEEMKAFFARHFA